MFFQINSMRLTEKRNIKIQKSKISAYWDSIGILKIIRIFVYIIKVNLSYLFEIVNKKHIFNVFETKMYFMNICFC